MTSLTEKLAALLGDIQDIEGVSVGTEDNKLAYLRVLAGIDWDNYLSDMVEALEVQAAAARVYLELNKGSATPELSGVAGCSVVGSNNNAVVESDGRTYVQWYELPPNTHTEEPAGLTFAQNLRADLPPYFQGTKIVVQSNKPYFRLNNLDVSVYETGKVIELTSAEDLPLLPSIEGEGYIKVYVCLDVLVEGTETSDWDSIYDPIPGDEKNRISWGSYLGSNTHPDIGAHGTNYVFRYGNFNGYGFSQPAGGSGGAFRVVYWDTGGTIHTFTVSLGVENFISEATTCLLIDDFLINNEFSVRMRRP